MAHNTKKPGLVLENLSAGYQKKIIVDDISLAIPQQKMTVLVGANGCGKSTLLSTIARLLQPLGGAAVLDGKAIHEQPTKAVARQLGILPQSPLLPEGLTVFELVSRGRFPWQNFMRQWSDEDELAVEEALRLTGTAEFAHMPVESLSGGQRQRCWIAMALAQQTPYILLDEPTTFLDLRYQVEILELLHTLTRRHGRTVVVVLHDLNFAVNYGDSLVFLRQGKVEGVLHEGDACTPELIKAVFDVDVHKPVDRQAVLYAVSPEPCSAMMRSSLALPIFVLLLALGAIMHLGIGARFIAPQTVVEAFFHFDPRNFDHNVIIKLRLLRLCAAMVTGAALGVAGVLLQSVIRNPLGEPHILGLNAGAALAVVITSVLGLSLPFGRPLVAAAGAAALFLLVLMFSSSGRTGLTPMKVTLCGVAMSAFASSITAAVLILDEQTLLAMRTWLAGDLAGINVQTLRSALWAAAAGFVLAIVLSPSLNMLALGDRMAQGLGVSLLKTRLLALLAIALLCGAAVSIAGPIGFIGLVVPQLIRRLVSVDLRVMVPLSALCGALVLLLADIAARTLFTPWELATGIMTALVGAPVFIFMASRMFK